MKLVIGYGNTLRGDDGAGQYVAQLLIRRQLPDVQVLTLHQLTPELAATIAEADEVFFVDAASVERVMCYELEPQPDEQTFDHTSSPTYLLTLTISLYEQCPRAWQVVVPAQRFTLGAPLSKGTKRAVTEACQLLETRLSPTP